MLMLATSLTAPGCARGQDAGEPIDPWSQVAIDDLHFIRATLRENHPGPADSVNPWFRDWYERGFNEALRLADRAEDYPGYYFSVQYFMQGFQDGHLGTLGEDLLDDERLSFSWPGFAVGYETGDFVVRHSELSELPPGALLISCDDRTADQLGRDVIRTYHGLWSVRGARSALAPTLFVGAGNPFVERPTVCRWLNQGEEIATTLSWRSISTDSLKTIIQGITRRISPEFGVRPFFGGSGYWISLPSFALGSDEVVAGMERVRSALRQQGDAIRRSDVIVVDVRGNGGGSSRLGEEIVELLWGPATLAAARPRGVRVYWRVSRDNARFLRRSNLRRLQERYGPDHPNTTSYRDFVERFERAVERGDIFYRHTSNEDETPVDTGNETHHVAAAVYFLTDHACFSACLDFADLMRRIPGVTHAGLETRADAVYIDNRAVRLPSGLGLLGFSMKVYRNRVRGHNESYVPEIRYEGDITDDRALEEWLLGVSR